MSSVQCSPVCHHQCPIAFHHQYPYQYPFSCTCTATATAAPVCHQAGSIVLVTRPSAAFGPAAPEWHFTFYITEARHLSDSGLVLVLVLLLVVVVIQVQAAPEWQNCYLYLDTCTCTCSCTTRHLSDSGRTHGGGSRVKGRLQWVGAKVELVLYNALYSQACVVHVGWTMRCTVALGVSMAPLCQGGLTPATAKSITNIDPARSINVKSITRNSQITWERALTFRKEPTF